MNKKDYFLYIDTLVIDEELKKLKNTIKKTLKKYNNYYDAATKIVIDELENILKIDLEKSAKNYLKALKELKK